MPIVLAVLASPAIGQSMPPLRPVDQGVEDVSPLAASLREIRPDLRAPTGFDRVYRVPGSANLLKRQHGAVSAVFTESEYQSTRAGLVPLVPAGTVWVIGEPAVGFTDSHMPASRYLEALPPNLLPGPHAPRARAPRMPGPLSPPVKTFAERADLMVWQPGDGRLALPVHLVPAVIPASAWETAAPSSTLLDFARYTSRDLTFEPYRQARIREITRRRGPARNDK